MKPLDLIETPRDDFRPADPRFRRDADRLDHLRVAARHPAGVRAEDGRLLLPEWT